MLNIQNHDQACTKFQNHTNIFKKMQIGNKVWKSIEDYANVCTNILKMQNVKKTQDSTGQTALPSFIYIFCE